MLSNPAWRGHQTEFAAQARDWLLDPGADGLMNVAMFMDAQVVAGDATLLQRVRAGLLELASGNDILVARFAAVIENFGRAPGWWSRLVGDDSAQSLDLKKQGIFPIVHGVRSLALLRQLRATSTADRIDTLAADGTLSAELAGQLVESLHFLMGLKLAAGLNEIDAGHPVSGLVDARRLSSLERDLLNDTLAVVRRFKTLLRLRLRLEQV